LRVTKRIEVTQRQFDIISTKLEAMIEMQRDLKERLERYHQVVTDLEKEKTSG
jgi:hypothetical protein